MAVNTSWPRRLRRRLLTFVFTLYGNFALAALTLALGLLATVVGWLPPRGDWMYRLARLWSRLFLLTSGVFVRSRFDTRLEPNRGYIFMANHQSMYDVPALIVGMPGQVRFMAKRSLFKLPIFGWSLTAGGFIPVDQRTRETAQATFQNALQCLRDGKSLLIFPEETRSYDGELLPFKRGGVLLAMRTGFPIVPVGIDGTMRVRPRGSWTITPGRVDVHYGAPIEIGEGDVTHRRELAAKVRSEVERLHAAAGNRHR